MRRQCNKLNVFVKSTKELKANCQTCIDIVFKIERNFLTIATMQTYFNSRSNEK